MELLPTDFESAASASSAIPARVSALAIGAVSIAAFCGRHLNKAIVSLARQLAGRKDQVQAPREQYPTDLSLASASLIRRRRQHQILLQLSIGFLVGCHRESPIRILHAECAKDHAST